MKEQEKKQPVLIVIAILFAGLFALIIPAYAVESSKEQSANSDFTFTVLDDKSVEVSSYTGNATEVVIPDEAYGREVTSIGENAFYENENITRVEMPDTVTNIGRSAFWNCKSLISLDLSSNLTTISETAFGNTSLTSIEIPSTVRTIGFSAFALSKNLEKVVLNEGLETVGLGAFQECTKLKSITIPASVTTIEDNAFGYKDKDLAPDASYEEIMATPDKIEGFKIYCYKGTAGEDYVINNGFDYEYLEAEPTEAKTEPSSESESAIEATTSSSDVQTIAQPSDGNPVQSDNTAYIIVIVVESIIILALLAVIIMILIKKKKSI